MKNLIHEPYMKVKGALREKHITYNDIALTLGVSQPCVCQKINGTSDFYLDEASKLCDKYGFSRDIFLP